MSHNVPVIEVLFGVILVLLAVALFVSFRMAQGGSGDDKVLKDLESSLKKMIESLQATPNAQVTAAADSIRDEEGLDAISLEELAQLQGQLAEKDKTITDLKAALSDVQRALSEKAGGGSADVAGLEAKVKELQARLGEYEIIEDDIANLSKYKSENQKLREELDRLRGAGTPLPPNPGDDVLNEFANTVTNAQVLPEDPNAKVSFGSGGEPMEAFASAVQGEVSSGSVASPAAAAPAPAPAPVAAPAPVPPPVVAAASAEAALESSAVSDLDAAMTIDPSKLMEEALGLANNGPEEDASAMDGPLNTDKLMAEAMDLGGDSAQPAASPEPLTAVAAPSVAVPPAAGTSETKEPPEDENSLLNEFESFLKDKPS